MTSEEFDFKIKFPVFGDEIRLNSKKIHGKHAYFVRKNVPIQKIRELASLYFKQFHNPEDIWESYDRDYDGHLKKDKEGNVILDKVRAKFYIGFDGYKRPTGEWFSQSYKKSFDIERLYKSFPKSYYIVGLAIEVELENPESTLENKRYTVRGGVFSVTFNMKAEDTILDKIKDILSEQNIPNTTLLHTDEKAKKELIGLNIKKQKILNLLAKVEELINSMTLECGRLPGYDSEVSVGEKK